MPRISLISDLHIEFSMDLVLPGGDILILAGDMCEVKNLKHSIYQDWVFENLTKYREVLYCLGNHEHHYLQVQKTKTIAQDYLPDNVTILENETKIIDDIMFVGGTLWTDMNRNDPMTMLQCQQYMTDYNHITMYDQDKDAYHKLTPEYTTVMHCTTRDYIIAEADANPDKKIVVLTHMLPSVSAISAEYKNNYHLNGAFASDLDYIMLEHTNIKVWCFGHTHSPIDIRVGETRLLCNPRGYSGYEQRTKEFDPSFGFDI